MENENKTIEPEKDAVLAKLERMLASMPENSRQPILNLINKRKVELGLLKSELPHAGYKLKKAHEKRKPISKERKDSLQKIAMTVGTVKETERVIPSDIDIKNESLKKDRKIIEEVDSYKY
ncbi:hypothetical protein ANME2D_01256 [Candidatus Methanoperedens nitroreducens]|uniref:Uncharacterized protein n=1 Tax=Candidatus Methanoperedens nitratireducens TaxID=1392998 RepID=A0A062V107_9EURY|nr:hypothetical protein [Candidatus Methanoperedens nitroreducens]KCZ72821.1 hypothetical protein ANME2D_01256 [Candidatus Methanoperedens nitroreducens]MDJ1423248.1 hypothetical protein [Candidatus Methanoperedens sp.]